MPRDASDPLSRAARSRQFSYSLITSRMHFKMFIISPLTSTSFVGSPIP
jgi:hypothetical protein